MAINGRQVGGLVGAVAVAGLLITAFESPGGKAMLHAYPDPVTHGAPWTACDGETAGIKPGMTFTPAACDAMTAALVKKTDAAVLACLGGTPPDNARAAFDSVAWNIGIWGFCNSSIPTRFKAHDLKGACNIIPLYNHAAGRVIPGLTTRRGAEQAICLEDVH